MRVDTLLGDKFQERGTITGDILILREKFGIRGYGCEVGVQMSGTKHSCRNSQHVIFGTDRKRGKAESLEGLMIVVHGEEAAR